MPKVRPLRRPQRRRRRLRSENPDVRRRLIEATTSLLEEEGFSRARIEEIAARAEVSVGTVYLYFEGKNDLFTTALVVQTQELRERLVAAYRGGGSAIDRLVRGIDAYLDFIVEHASSFLYFRDAGAVHTNTGSLLGWIFAYLAEEVAPVLREGMEAGEIARADPELLAQALLGMLHHTTGYWLERNPNSERAELRGFLIGLCGLGVAGAHGSAQRAEDSSRQTPCEPKARKGEEAT